jgi:hypothetical protein
MHLRLSSIFANNNKKHEKRVSINQLSQALHQNKDRKPSLLYHNHLFRKRQWCAMQTICKLKVSQLKMSKNRFVYIASHEASLIFVLRTVNNSIMACSKSIKTIWLRLSKISYQNRRLNKNSYRTISNFWRILTSCSIHNKKISTFSNMRRSNKWLRNDYYIACFGLPFE